MKRTPLALDRINPNFTAHSLNDFFHDRQSYTRPAVLVSSV